MESDALHVGRGNDGRIHCRYTIQNGFYSLGSNVRSSATMKLEPVTQEDQLADVIGRQTTGFALRDGALFTRELNISTRGFTDHSTGEKYAPMDSEFQALDLLTNPHYKTVHINGGIQ